ncbi:hypothetical protein CALCODRAFT_479372 [Calocera cornea HHB12733]|uniref:Uncharacterized protein n=1 Tax=Calocera cornea HHB12733 TaxID=1353952 RepID=A0A165JRI5_9BASI|nr:hypothetical protein CALCODRAFT_479372 [Calocera cornea HHB12733]
MAFIRFNGLAQMFQAALSGGNPQAANVVDVDYNGFNFQLGDPSNDDFLHYMALPNSQESQAWSYDSQNTAYESEDNNHLISAPAPAVGALHTPTQANLAQDAVPTSDDKHVIAYNPPKSHQAPTGARGKPTVHAHISASVTTAQRAFLPYHTDQTAGRGYRAARTISLEAPPHPVLPMRNPPENIRTAIPARAVTPDLDFIKQKRIAYYTTITKSTRMKREREEEDLHELPPATRRRVDKSSSCRRQEPEGSNYIPIGRTSGRVVDTMRQHFNGPPNGGWEWGSVDPWQLSPPTDGILTSGSPTDFRSLEDEMARADREEQERLEDWLKAAVLSNDLDSATSQGAPMFRTPGEPFDPRLAILQDHLAAVGAVPPPPPAPLLPSPPGTPGSDLSDLPPLPDLTNLPPLVVAMGPPHENPIGAPSSSAFINPIAAQRSFAALPKRARNGRGAPQTTATRFDGRGALDMVDPVRCNVEPDEEAIVQPLRVDKGKKRAVEKRSVEDDADSPHDASRKRTKISIQSHSPTRRSTTSRRGRNIPTHSDTGSWVSVETSGGSLEQSPLNTTGIAAGTSGSSHNNAVTCQQWLASTANLPPHFDDQGDVHRMGSMADEAIWEEALLHVEVDSTILEERTLVYGMADHNAAEADCPVLVIPDGRASATNTTVLPWVQDAVQAMPEHLQAQPEQVQDIPAPLPVLVRATPARARTTPVHPGARARVRTQAGSRA